MINPDESTRLRAEEIADELAIRRAEQRMAREEREMERELREFDDAETRVKRQVEQEWRREHSGHEPERLPAWQTTDGQGLSDRVPAAFSRLPSLVRDYVSRALPRSQAVAARVTVAQTGEMVLKPGAAPRPFTATESLATDQVKFTWRARFPIFRPLSLHVTDSYAAGAGLLQVRLLGLPIQSKRGPGVAAGEALRYLAELPWVPHAIVSNPELVWREIDATTVEVATGDAGTRSAVNLIFDRSGDIVRAVARRPRLEADGEPTPWIGFYGDYREFGGVRLPTRGEVRWELPEGPFTYWRGAITAFEAHDQPDREP